MFFNHIFDYCCYSNHFASSSGTPEHWIPFCLSLICIIFFLTIFISLFFYNLGKNLRVFFLFFFSPHCWMGLPQQYSSLLFINSRADLNFSVACFILLRSFHFSHFLFYFFALYIRFFSHYDVLFLSVGTKYSFIILGMSEIFKYFPWFPKS